MRQRTTTISRFAQPQAEQTAFLRLKSRRPDARIVAVSHSHSHSASRFSKNSLQTEPKGFSLVELLVALSIFMIISFATLPLMISNMHLNQKNQIRNDAISVAGRWVDWLHSRDWRPVSTGLLSVADIGQTVDSINSRFQYAIDCTQITVNRRFDCEVNVGWNYKGQDYNYDVTTIIIE